MCGGWHACMTEGKAPGAEPLTNIHDLLAFHGLCREPCPHDPEGKPWPWGPQRQTMNYAHMVPKANHGQRLPAAAWAPLLPSASRAPATACGPKRSPSPRMLPSASSVGVLHRVPLPVCVLQRRGQLRPCGRPNAAASSTEACMHAHARPSTAAAHASEPYAPLRATSAVLARRSGRDGSSSSGGSDEEEEGLHTLQGGGWVVEGAVLEARRDHVLVALDRKVRACRPCTRGAGQEGACVRTMCRWCLTVRCARALGGKHNHERALWCFYRFKEC